MASPLCRRRHFCCRAWKDGFSIVNAEAPGRIGQAPPSSPCHVEVVSSRRYRSYKSSKFSPMPGTMSVPAYNSRDKAAHHRRRRRSSGGRLPPDRSARFAGRSWHRGQALRMPCWGKEFEQRHTNESVPLSLGGNRVIVKSRLNLAGCQGNSPWRIADGTLQDLTMR